MRGIDGQRNIVGLGLLHDDRQFKKESNKQ
jgi:hypothetical protein